MLPSMRLYRVTRNDPPSLNDFQSAWDRGRRPARPSDERTFRAVSTFTSVDAAIRTAERFDLGEFIAELEVPDETSKTIRGEHVSLHDLTPDQLLLRLVTVRRRKG